MGCALSIVMDAPTICPDCKKLVVGEARTFCLKCLESFDDVNSRWFNTEDIVLVTFD